MKTPLVKHASVCILMFFPQGYILLIPPVMLSKGCCWGGEVFPTRPELWGP